MENNKKTWLVVLVVLAVGAAVAVGLTMGGKLFKGNIGGGPVTCEEGAKGCVTTCEEGAKGCPTSGPVSGPTSGPITNPTSQSNYAITKAHFITLLVRGKSVGNEAVQNCKESPFSDTKGHKFEKYICYAAQVGWVNGYADGTFKPDNNLSRAEGSKMIVMVFEMKTYTNKVLAEDISKNDWYFEFANTLIRYKFPNSLSNCAGGGCGGPATWFHAGDSLSKKDAESWVLFAKKLKK